MTDTYRVFSVDYDNSALELLAYWAIERTIQKERHNFDLPPLTKDKLKNEINVRARLSLETKIDVIFRSDLLPSDHPALKKILKLFGKGQAFSLISCSTRNCKSIDLLNANNTYNGFSAQAFGLVERELRDYCETDKIDFLPFWLEDLTEGHFPLLGKNAFERDGRSSTLVESALRIANKYPIIVFHLLYLNYITHNTGTNVELHCLDDLFTDEKTEHGSEMGIMRTQMLPMIEDVIPSGITFFPHFCELYHRQDGGKPFFHSLTPIEGKAEIVIRSSQHLQQVMHKVMKTCGECDILKVIEDKAATSVIDAPASFWPPTLGYDRRFIEKVVREDLERETHGTKLRKK